VTSRARLLLGVVALVASGLAAWGVGGTAAGRNGAPPGQLLIARSSDAQLRDEVPIARHLGERRRSVFSRPLPTVRRGDRISFNGEVTLTMTCVERLPRCIGRMYHYSPHFRAQAVLAQRPGAAGRGTEPVSDAVSLTCGQRRPNRNHHCPLVIDHGSIAVHRPRSLPCPPRECRLKMVVDAYNRRAEQGDVVIVSAERASGSVKGGMGRLNAVVKRRGSHVASFKRTTARRLVRHISAAFDGGERAVYSLRMGHLERGDVLVVRARQRTAIRRLPYYVSEEVVVTTRRSATNPNPFTRRVTAPHGTATAANGFNCTIGVSDFSSPCLGRKAGVVAITRTPRRPLFVVLRSRGFPKLAQAKRGSYPPLRILRGGGLTVTRLRAGG
jgi:hypothetical protein